MDDFTQGLEKAYARLEYRLDSAKKEALDRFRQINKHFSNSDSGFPCYPKKGQSKSGYIRDNIIVIKEQEIRHYHDESRRRVLIDIGKGYMAKVAPESISENLGATFYGIHTCNVRECRYEEINYEILRKAGFTSDNGFIVARHKVIGVRLVNENAHVVPGGDGWSIIEDLSANGVYTIELLSARHFIQLENADDLFNEYLRYRTALSKLFRNPYYHVEKNMVPIKPDLDAIVGDNWLLVRIKDHKGEMVIGNLDGVTLLPRAQE